MSVRVGGRLRTYLVIDLIDELDSLFHVASVDGVAHSDALPNALHVLRVAEVGLLSKFLCCGGIAFRDEIVHDDPVDLAASELVSWELVKPGALFVARRQH